MLVYVDRVQRTLEHPEIRKQMMIVLHLPLQVVFQILLNCRVFDLRGQRQRFVGVFRVLPTVDVHHEAAETEAKRDAHQKGENEIAALCCMRCLGRQFGVEDFLGHFLDMFLSGVPSLNDRVTGELTNAVQRLIKYLLMTSLFDCPALGLHRSDRERRTR